MFSTVSKIASKASGKVAFKSIINLYVGFKKVITGRGDSKDVAEQTGMTIAKDTAVELVRASVKEAATLLPGGAIVQGLAKTAVDMSMTAVNSNYEGKTGFETAKKMTKAACYAANTAMFGPVPGFVAGYGTDYAVDYAADKVTFAYDQYQQYQCGKEQQAAQRQSFSNLLRETVKDDVLNEEFCLLSSPAA